ncbi:MAG: DUF3794 domain-containing protein [Oscillospiraceae bacterium]|nr:DUF3794 domain-containing protein [Oscillospiraceae bacterium]
MELQFNEVTYPCLRTIMSQVRNEELTQELRLPDGMPDVGRILGCWAMPLVRGKEWRRGGMNVSGGCQVWVLYAPEDGTEAQSLESWMPFQLKWDFADTDHDGVIQVSCLCGFADARTVSARKLMLRVGVSAMGDAWLSGKATVYSPGEVPEDVQLLKRNYPMRLPVEAGEKAFSVEEPLNVPSDLEKIIRYCLQPELIDQKVMAGKVVFRGMLLGHILYRNQSGDCKTWDFEVPFSQYAELEKDYDSEAEPMVTLCLTGAELDREGEQGITLKVGLTGQYVICDRPVIELVEDAYSPCRDVALRQQDLDLPAILDDRRENVRIEKPLEGTAGVLDAAFYGEQPVKRQGSDGVCLELSGQFQVLSVDPEGKLQGQTFPWNADMTLPADPDTAVWAVLNPTGKVTADTSLKADAAVQTVTASGKEIPMVTGLELGEKRQPDASRPSLILQRCREQSLWQLAKTCGSTVEAICQANDLTCEPERGRMLLIPIL